MCEIKILYTNFLKYLILIKKFDRLQNYIYFLFAASKIDKDGFGI